MKKIWMVNRHWKTFNFISVQENAIKIKICYHLPSSSQQYWKSEKQMIISYNMIQKFFSPESI